MDRQEWINNEKNEMTTETGNMKLDKQNRINITG